MYSLDIKEWIIVSANWDALPFDEHLNQGDWLSGGVFHPTILTPERTGDAQDSTTPMKITGRSSSITNAFANAIIPAIEPNESEISAALDLLDMTVETICCAYCGDKHSEWDHLRPLIKDKRPIGYVSEIDNLVPSCGKCNQSKGNKGWRAWMLGPARLSPASRQVHDLQRRVERLAAYEENGKVTKIDFEAVLDVELWNEHWDN